MGVADLQNALAEPDALRAVHSPALVDVPAGSSTVKVVPVPPVELAADAGVSLEEYSLARVLASEGYGGNPVGKAAAAVVQAQCVLVEVRRRNSSGVTRLVTASQFQAASGWYGQQRGRYVATTRNPGRWHLRVAQAVLGGDVPDLARGAYHFLAPEVFVGGVQAGQPLPRFEAVIRDWILSERNCLRSVPTVDPFYLMIIGPGGTAGSREVDVQRALQIFEDGRGGRSAPAGGNPDGAGGLIPGAILAVCVGAAAYFLGGIR